jgi:transposase
MRKRRPAITESADELHQRLKQEKDVKQRHRVQALYLVASGHARPRQDLAVLLGVHRHSVAAWLDASAAGGLEQALSYQVPRPPRRQRITPTALAALQDRLQDPHGFAGYAQLRAWLAEQHQVSLSYAGVYAVVRGKLRAKPTRPRPSHAQKVPKRCPSSARHSPQCSTSTVPTGPTALR